MAQITIWGDFKVDNTENLNLSGELQLLLNQSDANVLNFEAPVKCNEKPIAKSGPNISQDLKAPKWIEEHGYNIVSLANNHAMDFGTKGLQKTKAMFNTACVIGAGTWKEAYRIHTITTSEGQRIGFLAATHCEFGTMTDKMKDQYGCAWCQHPDFERLILDKKGIDYLIIYNPGGIEYMDMPLPEWRELYKKWIDLGADAVVASHPHVPQGYEIYKGKLICYSLGNFCFQKKKVMYDHWFESLCCVLNIAKDGKIEFKIYSIYYDIKSNYLDINESVNFQKHLVRLNETLADKEIYMKYINREVLRRYRQYQGLFTRGGWIVNVFPGSFLKGIAEKFKKEHIYNCLSCESHRWAIIRALRLKYDI